MKIVFFGTPEIAKVCLEELTKSKHKVLAVFTKPDKPVGRGRKISQSPVKKFANENKISVFQFDKLKNESIEIIKNLQPDVLILVAFGQILSQEILDIALPLNLHASLLPLYRGASPIQTAILNGETESGLTVMKMEQELDAGDILLQKKVKIYPNDTSKTLFERMGNIGAKLILEALQKLENGNFKWIKQDNKKATYSTFLTKQQAQLDFNDFADNIINKVRAFNPNPVAFFVLSSTKYKIYSCKKLSNINSDKNYQNGEIVMANSKRGLIIKCKDGFVEILELQAPNGKILNSKQFLNGNSIPVGAVVRYE